MAETPVQGTNGSVFISYSRKDKDFVRTLYDGLVAHEVQAWVDWEGIPLSADWMDEITRAVNGADAFLVILSPDWLASKVCADELELGLASKKKLIPILYRDPLPGTTMHEKLAATNWVYLRAQDDFDATLPKLVEAIGTDLDWVRQHTRLLNRANEWNQKNRNASFLLQGADLEDGEKWMGEAAQNAKREVVPLQTEYIATSRKEALRRQRMLLVGVSLALVVSVILAIMAIFQWNAANAASVLAKNNEAKAVANEHARATQQVIAQQNEKLAQENEILAKKNEGLAKKNEILALAQRNAAEAKLYQGKAGDLDLSTLLAIMSWQRSQSFQAEEIFRQNITLLAVPEAQMSQAGQINDIQFSPDGKWFVTPSEDGTACVWKVRGGQKQYCIQHEQSVSDAGFSNDGQWLATASADGSARLWKAADGSFVKRYDLVGTVWDVKFSPNSEWLVMAHDAGMKAVNLVNPLQKDRDVKTPDPAYVLTYSPDSNWVGIGMSSGKTQIWHTGSLYTNPGPTHLSEVLAITFDPSGKFLLSSGADSFARLGRTESGRQVGFFRAGDWIEDIKYSPDGTWFAAASDDNQVWVWDLQSGESKMRLRHAGFVMKVDISSDGQWIASTGFDKTMRIWDARSGEELIQASLDQIGSALAITPDGQAVIVGDRSGKISIWGISGLAARIGYLEFPEFVHEVKLSPDAKRLLANSDDKKLWSFDLSDLLISHTTASAEVLYNASGLTYSMDVSPDSKWVALAQSQEHKAVLFHLQDRKAFILQQTEDVTDVAFSPDGSRLAVSDKSGKVILWTVQTGEQDYELLNASAVLSLGFSPDGKKLVAGLGGRSSTAVWDLATKTKIAEMSQVGDVTSVLFSADGEWVATGDTLGVINLWNARDFSLKAPLRTLRLNSDVLNLLFSPDRRWLVVGSSDGYARILDTVSGGEISRLPHVDEVTGLAFSADGKQLFTVSRKLVQVWDVSKLTLLPTEQLVETACSRLVTNMSLTEWQTLFGADEPYRLICPNLPQGKD